MPVDYPALQAYLETLVPARHPELVRMEAYAKEHEFPILGPASCQFCYVLAKLTEARRVFEMGSGYGYSTAWFARAVQENGGGIVHHTVWDRGLSDMAKGHLTAMGYVAVDSTVNVVFTMGEAVQALTATPEEFDIVFNDIDKQAYPDTIDLVWSRLRTGGLFITDNVVWSGRVMDESDQSEQTVAIREFTKRLTTDSRWDCTVVPIRDGLMVARKR